MPSLTLLYTTLPSAESAERIAEELLQKRLIACANILKPHLAIFRWEGKIQKDQEVIMLLKTQASLEDSVRETLSELHPYETPCILKLDCGANQSYFQWLVGETS